MFDSPVLEAAIGLTFIFLIYSLLGTSINEAIATLFGLRARMLRKSIIEGMLTQTTWKNFFKSLWQGIFGITVDFFRVFINRGKKPKSHIGWRFYDNPIIKNFGENAIYPYPSYIASTDFAKILRNTILENFNKDIVFSKHPLWESYSESKKLELLLSDPENFENGFLDEATLKILQSHFKEAKNDIVGFDKKLEEWFDSQMNRVTGWYKRQSQFFLFFIGLLMAFLLRIDTINICTKLLNDKSARAQLVELAVASSQNDKYKDGKLPTVQHDSTKDVIDQSQKIISETRLTLEKDMTSVKGLMALGWEHFGNQDKEYVYKLKQFKYKVEADTCYNITDTQITYSFSKTCKEDNSKKAMKFEELGSLLFKEDSKSIQALNDLIKNIPSFAENQLDSLKKESLKKTEEIDSKTALYIIQDGGFWYKLKYVSWKLLHRPLMIIGFLITAFAICLGSPFWFDLLNKLINLRASGKKEDTSSSSNSSKIPSPTTIVNNIGGNSLSNEKIPG